MEKQSAEKTLGKTLRDGEQVLWSGKTEVFPLLAGDAKVQILSKWIGTVAAAIVILALYIANGGNGKGMIAVVLGWRYFCWSHPLWSSGAFCGRDTGSQTSG